MNTAIAESTPSWLGLDLRRQRWLFPAAGLLTSSIRGAAAYTFSICILPLEKELGWARSETVLVFSCYTFVYALFMFIGGMIVDAFGPRRPFILGAILIVVSQILASQVATSFWLSMTYGFMLGCGVGLTSSAATVAMAARWYPEERQRGTAIGFSMMGIGVGGLVAARLWHFGMDQLGWRETVLLTAAVYGVVLAIAASIIRFPRPDEWESSGISEYGNDFDLMEALLTRELWTLALLLFLSMFGGLMVFSQLFPFFTESIAASGASGATIAAAAVIAQPVCNALGRPAWGWASGRMGIRFCIALCAMVMTGGLALLIRSGGHTLAPADVGWASLLAIGLIGFSFGGTVSVGANASATMFGTRYVAQIFGLVFLLGFGGAGVLGPMAGAYLRQATGDYHLSLYIAVGLSTLSAVFALIALPDRGFRRLVGER